MQIFKLSASSLKGKKKEKKTLKYIHCFTELFIVYSSRGQRAILGKSVLPVLCRSQGLNSDQAMFLPLKHLKKKKTVTHPLWTGHRQDNPKSS